MNAPKFTNRWSITGTLTTRSELHIGDGGVGEIRERHRPANKRVPGKDDESDASTVCTDHQGRAYIPGSGIKGALRALVMIPDPEDPKGERRIIHSDWEPLLGSDKPDAKGAVGGKLEFWHACHETGNGTMAEQPDPDHLYLSSDINRPWWDDKRKTCVAVAVSLDRRTRTAKENFLYHLEYVPVGETFAFEIGGDNLGEEAIARLLELLDRFNSGTATLGAQTSNGWGRMEMKLNEVRLLDSSGMEAWKKAPGASLPTPIKIDWETEKRIMTLKDAIILPEDKQWLAVDLKLTLDSPWLIRDPRQRERFKAGKDKDLPKGLGPPNAVSVHDETGNPFIPAKSLRGILRSRAEMILRTVVLPCADHPGKIKAVTTKGKTMEAVLSEIAGNDLVAKLFGLGGWMAPLEVPRLNSTETVISHPQEFVAIDRFTGGAVDGAKFNAELAGMTTVSGTLTVDLTRLEMVDKELASLGLLALVLRDLAEGDLPIGSGSAKGQGLCTATASVTHGGLSFGTLKEWFNSERVKTSLAAFRRGIKAASPVDHDSESSPTDSPTT